MLTIRRQWTVIGALWLLSLAIPLALVSHQIQWKGSTLLALISAGLAVVQTIVAAIMVRGLFHSRQQADAASSQLAENRAANIASLRAYLAIDEAKVKLSPKGFPEIHFIVKNWGQTPAMNSRLHYGIEIRDFNVSDLDVAERPIPDIAFLGEVGTCIFPGEFSAFAIGLSQSSAGAENHPLFIGQQQVFMAIVARYSSMGHEYFTELFLYTDGTIDADGTVRFWIHTDGVRVS